MQANQSTEIPFIGDLLTKHLNISDGILDAYFSLVPQPNNDNEVPSKNYIGKPSRYFQPYRVSVFGAYPLMKHWDALEYKMNNCDEENGYFKHYRRESLEGPLKTYAEGFKIGYTDFIDRRISNSELTQSLPLDIRL